MSLTKIEHGKVLNKNNFPQFVETFNTMVDFIKNIQGDYDTNSTNGHIRVDKSCITGPVIRFEGNLSAQGAEGEEQTLDVVTNVEWDSAAGNIKTTHQTIKFYGELSGNTTITTIGTDPWTGAPTPFPNVN